MRRESIAAELELIKSANGMRLLTEDVVAWTESNPDSMLYESGFPTDAEEALHKQRLHWARRIISVHVVVINDGQKKEMRAYYSPQPAKGESERGYETTASWLSDAEKRRELVLSQLQRMLSIYNSYPLEELDPIKRLIDQLTDQFSAPMLEAAE